MRLHSWGECIWRRSTGLNFQLHLRSRSKRLFFQDADCCSNCITSCLGFWNKLVLEASISMPVHPHSLNQSTWQGSFLERCMNTVGCGSPNRWSFNIGPRITKILHGVSTLTFSSRCRAWETSESLEPGRSGRCTHQLHAWHRFPALTNILLEVDHVPK